MDETTTQNRELESEKWKAKAELFKSRQMPVHIRINTGRFFGGRILRIYKDSLDIEDTKDGEYPIMFSEIVHLDKKRDSQ